MWSKYTNLENKMAKMLKKKNTEIMTVKKYW